MISVEDAEGLAARVLAAVGRYQHQFDNMGFADIPTADRERVLSDLAGLREHQGNPFLMECLSHGADEDDRWADRWAPKLPCDDHKRYEAGLRRTADLYGVS